MIGYTALTISFDFHDAADYSNVAPYDTVTDVIYNGGVITNIVIPKASDNAPVALWTAAMLRSAAVLIGKKKTKA